MSDENGYKPSKAAGRLGCAFDYYENARWQGTPYWLVDRKAATRKVIPKQIADKCERKNDQKTTRKLNQIMRLHLEAFAEDRSFKVFFGEPIRDSRGWARPVSTDPGTGPGRVLRLTMRVNADFSTHIESCFSYGGEWRALTGRGGSLTLGYVVKDKLRAVLMPMVGNDEKTEAEKLRAEVVSLTRQLEAFKELQRAAEAVAA